MTMHHVGIELARDRLTKAVFQRSVINGEMFTLKPPRKPVSLDAVVATAEDLMPAAVAMASN